MSEHCRPPASSRHWAGLDATARVLATAALPTCLCVGGSAAEAADSRGTGRPVRGLALGVVLAAALSGCSLFCTGGKCYTVTARTPLDTERFTSPEGRSCTATNFMLEISDASTGERATTGYDLVVTCGGRRVNCGSGGATLSRTAVEACVAAAERRGHFEASRGDGEGGGGGTGGGGGGEY